MRKMKRALGFTLAAILTASMLAGCGTKKDGGSPAAGGDGSFDGTFLIGGSGPLSGDNASYGTSVKQGAQVAVDEINAAGGVKAGDKTYKLELTYLDDQAQAQPAVAAYSKLVDSGVNAILGTVTSGSCEAIVDLTAEDGILQITPSGSSKACTKNPNNFRICFTDPLQGITMADFAIDKLGYKNIAMIYNGSDSYSSGMAEAFEQEVKEKGATLVAKESFNEGDVDFNTQLTSIKDKNPDVIFAPVYYQAGAYILDQSKKLGMEIPIIGGDGWDGILKQLQDKTVANGVIFLSPFLATDETPVVKNFVEKYKANYSDVVPDQFAADAYDGVYVIKAAMEKAGSIENEALIAAMTEIKVDGTTGSMTFTPEGEPNKEPKLIEIKDGEYTLRK